MTERCVEMTVRPRSSPAGSPLPRRPPLTARAPSSSVVAELPLNQQAGHSFKYLYERLGEKPFQQLCSALLVEEFPGVTCYPVGQRDGGRDASQKQPDGRVVIYQVKWTSKRLQAPVPWLTKAIDSEAKNIQRLAAAGAEEYVLITCVAGTSDYDRGTMDIIDQLLKKYSKEFKIPMSCWWQADIDGRVDRAPDSLKWSYANMLAGHDFMRYLIRADADATKDSTIQMVLKTFVATQSVEDSKVKFKQAELDSHDLVSLFVDVEAVRIAAPRRVVGTIGSLQGAAQYLLSTSQPLTLVRGEPGQGKSTLGQYLCQTHRMTFLQTPDGRPRHLAVSDRLPIRMDLRDYALWLEGGDPFSEDETRRTAAGQARSHPVIEEFLAKLIQMRSGGGLVDVETARDILSRSPILLVLDGLDEVANESTRTRVVREIDEFSARLGAMNRTGPQLIVTTRPNASNLSEPSPDMFETIALAPLSLALRAEYLRKWSDAQGIQGQDRRELNRTFNQRTTEPHIAQLANNPMQLTILLYLMRKRGDSVPAGRTELYRSYMETFLDRESTKSQAVLRHRADLEEATAYLGWRVQGLAETAGNNGKLRTNDVKKAILDHLFCLDKDVSLVDDLFTAVTDRVWALTSKVQGTFEFDVQPVREYFAARYLWEYAGGSSPTLHKSEILRYLIRRPYWLNTSRFFAGFATANEVTSLVEGLEEEFEFNEHPAQIRVGAWSLLADGVFSARPKTQRRAAELFIDDLSVRLLVAMGDDLDLLPLDRGASAIVEKLHALMLKETGSPLAVDRGRLSARLDGDRARFDAWWQPGMAKRAGTDDETVWLQIAIAHQGGSRLPSHTLANLALTATKAAEAALSCGITPSPESDQEQALLSAVCSGLCSDAQPTTAGFAADLIRVLAPQNFLQKVHRYRPSVSTGHADYVEDSRVSVAFRRLRDRDPRFDAVQRAMKFGRGQANTTSPWGNTARELSRIVGPCWLSAEIAIIGAASNSEEFVIGGDITPNSSAFGSAPDYGRLLRDVRLNRSTDSWWLQQLKVCTDELSKSTWVLALVTSATPAVLIECMLLLTKTVQSLSARAVRALCLSSSRIGISDIARRLSDGDGVLEFAVDVEVDEITMLLLAHHGASFRSRCDLPFTTLQLAAMGTTGAAAWPATRALTARMLASPSRAVLEALQVHGPQAVVDLTNQFNDEDKIPPEFADLILAEPALYPLGWIDSAQRTRSAAKKEQHLAAVAESEEWFCEA